MWETTQATARCILYTIGTSSPPRVVVVLMLLSLSDFTSGAMNPEFAGKKSVRKTAPLSKFFKDFRLSVPLSEVASGVFYQSQRVIQQLDLDIPFQYMYSAKNTKDNISISHQ